MNNSVLAHWLIKSSRAVRKRSQNLLLHVCCARTSFVSHVKLIFKSNIIEVRKKAAVCRCSSKEVFLKISQYFQGNTCVGASFNKVAGLEAYNFIKERLQHRCFPVNIANFLKTDFLTEHVRWLLLYWNYSIQSGLISDPAKHFWWSFFVKIVVVVN